jgi:hypothetical protein
MADASIAGGEQIRIAVDSRKVLPGIARNNHRNGTFHNAELFGEFFPGVAGCKLRSDCKHSLLREFGHPMVRPFLDGNAPLPESVSHVFSMASFKEMVRIAARWIVAMVRNFLAFRDWAVKKFPKKTMRSSVLFVPNDGAVFSGRTETFPFPTRRWKRSKDPVGVLDDGFFHFLRSQTSAHGEPGSWSCGITVTWRVHGIDDIAFIHQGQLA